MIWIFSVSAGIITIFLSLKILEEKKQKVSRLSQFLGEQDYRVERLISRLIFFYRLFKKSIKFFFLVKLPFLIHLLFKKIVQKSSIQFDKIKDYIRRKYIARRRKGISNRYLKELSKIKEDKQDEDKKENLVQ